MKSFINYKFKFYRHLEDFGINLDHDIVGNTTDGCRWMTKLGKLMSCDHIICQNHTNHLGVSDYLYPKKTQSIEDSSPSDNPTDWNLEFEEEMTDEEDDPEENPDEMQPGFEDSVEIIEEEPVLELDGQIASNLVKIRSIINFIRRGETKNNVFQKYVGEQFGEGKERELFLDFKVRWHTIFNMLDRFLECEMPIKKTLSDFDRSEMLDSINFELLKDIRDALQPIMSASRAMEKSNTNLLQSDTIMEMLCRRLESLKSQIADDLLQSIKNRYEQRKNKLTISLCRYLQDPDFIIRQGKKHVFSYASKYQVVSHAKDLMQKLFSKETEESSSSEDEEISPKRMKLSFAEEIEQALNEENKKDSVAKPSFQKELTLFEATGVRTENVKLLFDALKTIQATSCDSERTFSVCTRVCTKVRSRLSDKNLNIIIFLKHYLLNKNK